MKLRAFRLLPLIALTPGCVSVSVGTDDDEFLRMRGLGTAYAAVPGIDDYDGKIIRIGLLSGAPDSGQLAGIDVWPLCSVGVGLVGARVRVLPFEIGAGVLFYTPQPIRRDLGAKEKRTKRAPVTNQVHDQAISGEDVPIRPIEPTAPAPKQDPPGK